MGALRTVALHAAIALLVIPTVSSVSKPSAMFASERFCLAQAIYFEARGEPVVGQMAVGRVIMNRTRSAHYPHTICGVVNQNADLFNRCQFSYRCDGKVDLIAEREPWQQILRRSALLMDATMTAPTLKCRVEPWHFRPTTMTSRYRRVGRESFAAPYKSVGTSSIRADGLDSAASASPPS